MVGALSNIQSSIADSLGIQNKSRKRNFEDPEDFLSPEPKNSKTNESSKAHDHSVKYKNAAETLKTLQKMTQGGLGGYVAWKIEELKAKIKEKVTQQIMENRGITPESLEKMKPDERAKLEEEIDKEVARVLKEMIEEDAKKNSARKAGQQEEAMAGNDLSSKGLVSRLAPVPPLMAESDGNIQSLEDNIRSSLANLYGDNGFSPRPPISLTVDDRGKIKICGERNDIADIQAAIDNDLELTRDLQLYGAAVASSAMLAAEANTGAGASSSTDIDSAAGYRRWIAERTPRQSVLRFNGARIELLGTNKIIHGAS